MRKDSKKPAAVAAGGSAARGGRPIIESNAAKGRKLAIAMLQAFERAPDCNVMWANKVWRDKGRQQYNICFPFLRALAESPKLAEGFASMLTDILLRFDQGMNPAADELTLLEKAGVLDHAAPGEDADSGKG